MRCAPTLHAGCMPRMHPNPQPDAPVLTVALIVVDEVRNDGLRDDVADVFGVLVLEALEGNANALPRGVESRAATVAAVDLPSMTTNKGQG